jgi:hypothetical protein
MRPLTLTTVEPGSEPFAPNRLGSVFQERGLPGATFNNGLLRFHNAESGALAEENLLEFFGERALELTPFAVDWRGRHFCRVDIDGQDMAIRTDCAFIEASTLDDFPGTLEFLLDHPGAAEVIGAPEMQEAFDALGVFGLTFTDSIGMKIPAFLGGEEELSNYEVNNMDVYWSINAQIYNQVKDLPPGTPITGFAAAE